REPAALVDDAGLTAWLFRLGRLLRLFGLVELVGLLSLVDLGDLRFVGLRLAGDVVSGLVGLLDLAHHVAELEAKLMGDDAPTLVGLTLRDDLVERRLLTEALVPLHQLLRQRERDRRLTIAVAASAQAGDDRRVHLELLGQPLVEAALALRRARGPAGVGIELLGLRVELSLVL